MTNVITGDRQQFMRTLADVVRRDQTRRQRRDKIRKAVGGCTAFLILAAGLWALRAWMFMLAVGVIHAEWLPRVPTLGYWWAGLVAWLLCGALATGTSAKKDDKKAGAS
jgi:hypothetical protein